MKTLYNNNIISKTKWVNRILLTQILSKVSDNAVKVHPEIHTELTLKYLRPTASQVSTCHSIHSATKQNLCKSYVRIPLQIVTTWQSYVRIEIKRKNGRVVRFPREQMCEQKRSGQREHQTKRCWNRKALYIHSSISGIKLIKLKAHIRNFLNLKYYYYYYYYRY